MNDIEHLINLTLLPSEKLSPLACRLAALSLFDVITCGLAGAGEPLAEKLRVFAENEGSQGHSSIIAGGTASPRTAALVNGATCHALDYDDTHFAHIGHLAVGVYPAALAVGEQVDASAKDVVESFLVGAEAAIRVGVRLGTPHYNLGFHQTATAGAFGATLAAGRLLGLNADELRVAVGLCSTRASGLKSQFGTMGKPYNAGIAASNGIECAQLAKLGFSSSDDGILGPQAFVETHTPTPSVEDPWDNPPPGRFLFEDNKYKLHACCHGTHAMIEALLSAGAADKLTLDNVASIHLRTNPRWLKVCNLPNPRTGLEVKFSYKWLAGMVLRGDDTGSDRTYRDALAQDAALKEFANKVIVTGDDSVTDLQAFGNVTLMNGTKIEISHDLAAFIEAEELSVRLRAKAVSILGGQGDDIWARLDDLNLMSARDLGVILRDM